MRPVRAAWVGPGEDDVTDAGYLAVTHYADREEDVIVLGLDPDFPSPRPGAVLLIQTSALREALDI